MAKRGFMEIEGVQSPMDPENRVKAYLWIEDFKQTYIYAQWKAELVRSAIEVLKKPECILEAVRDVRDRELFGYCYTGRPLEIPNGHGGVRPIPKGDVVAVYMDTEYTIWEWGLEKCEEDGLTPKHPDARFDERLFP